MEEEEQWADANLEGERMWLFIERRVRSWCAVLGGSGK